MIEDKPICPMSDTNLQGPESKMGFRQRRSLLFLGFLDQTSSWVAEPDSPKEAN
jgi:hypothetical protein